MVNLLKYAGNTVRSFVGCHRFNSQRKMYLRPMIQTATACQYGGNQVPQQHGERISNFHTSALREGTAIFKLLGVSEGIHMSKQGSSLVRSYSRRAEPKLTVEEVRTRVLKVCAAFDKINADKLTIDSHFMNDLGLDSLDHVEVIMAIEDEFGFEVPDSDAEKLLRPSDIAKYVAEKKDAIESEES